MFLLNEKKLVFFVSRGIITPFLCFFKLKNIIYFFFNILHLVIIKDLEILFSIDSNILSFSSYKIRNTPQKTLKHT